MDYQAYLRSEAWRKKRAALRKRARNRCRVCGTSENLHTHHKTYRNIGKEPLHDLVMLCADHHKGCHEFITMWRAKGYEHKSSYTLTMKYIARERAKLKKRKKK